MTFEYTILILGYIFGFYMAWNIGANDTANAMASAVGAKAITIRQAIFISGILNILGAVFVGSHVTDTIRRGIVSPEVMADPKLVIIGALSALIASALWVFFATWKALPVSTTHSIVGAMVGFGIMVGGFSVVNWSKLVIIVVCWIVAPFFSMILAFVMFKVIYRYILIQEDLLGRAIRLSPYFIGITFFIVILSFLFKTPLGKKMALGTVSSIGIGLVGACVVGYVGKVILQRYMKKHGEEGVEDIFRHLQVGTSCYVALSIGANDVANAIGPLAVIYFFVKTGTIGGKVAVPVFLLLFGGVGIACGIFMWGHRVIETVGHKITTLTNTRGFAVDFGAATTVLVASKLGLPVSTTHAAVGSVIGVGLARGIEAVNFRIVFQIMLYWFITVPASAITSMVIYKILCLIFF
ncbi:MAG: inorganic phosphate transporter [Thermodesulfobacteriota bacterium]|nr:inorganic phosphate transporter [Thermodesulfobacteriota bacterium]